MAQTQTPVVEKKVQELPRYETPRVKDVSEMEINDTVVLSALAVPEGVTLLDDIEETVVATLSPPRLQSEIDEEIESETEVVGEGAADGDAAADAGSEDSSDGE